MKPETIEEARRLLWFIFLIIAVPFVLVYFADWVLYLDYPTNLPYARFLLVVKEKNGSAYTEGYVLLKVDGDHPLTLQAIHLNSSGMGLSSEWPLLMGNFTFYVYGYPRVIRLYDLSPPKVIATASKTFDLRIRRPYDESPLAWLFPPRYNRIPDPVTVEITVEVPTITIYAVGGS